MQYFGVQLASTLVVLLNLMVPGGLQDTPAAGAGGPRGAGGSHRGDSAAGGHHSAPA